MNIYNVYIYIYMQFSYENEQFNPGFTFVWKLHNYAPLVEHSQQLLVAIDSNSLYIYIYIQYNTIRMYSGITSGRVLDGELLYTKILEVNLFAFAYRLISVGKCKQINF